MTFPLDNDIQSINIMEFINYDIQANSVIRAKNKPNADQVIW